MTDKQDREMLEAAADEYAGQDWTQFPRLSHDRGADAEERSLALSALGESLREAEATDRSVIVTQDLARYLMRALSVPAPTLPALDALMDAEHRFCVEVEGEFALEHPVERHRRQAEFILESLRDAV